MSPFRFLFLSIGILVLLPADVYAQTVPDSAGRVEERLTPEMRGEDSSPNFQVPQMEGFPSTGEDIGPSKQDAGIKFPVTEIYLSGNTVFSSEQLREDVKNAVGDSVTLTDLKQAAINVTNRYHEADYPFAKAFIPKQTIGEDHVVTMEVIEGYIADVEYRGLTISNTSRVNDYAEALKEKKPVTRKDLEKYILLINELAGLEARAIMSLVEGQPGAVKLILLFDRHDNEAGASLNNSGSDSIGPLQASTFYKINNLTGFDDQLIFNTLVTPGSRELRYVAVEHNFPIGSEGGKVSFGVRHSKTNPGGQARSFDIAGESNGVNIAYSRPLIKSFRTNLITSLAFDMRNSSTKSLGQELINDRMRILRAKLSYRGVNLSGSVTSVETEISKGLNALGATDEGNLKASVAGARSDTTKVTASIIHFKPLNDKLILTAKLTGQWAHDLLLSAERFGVGGREYGRAFDYSTIIGDRGYAGALELTYKIPHEFQDINKLDLYGFIDSGRVFDHLQPADKKWQALSSAGLGLNIGYLKFINFNLEVAKPLRVIWNRTDVDENDLNIYGGVVISKKF